MNYRGGCAAVGRFWNLDEKVMVEKSFIRVCVFSVIFEKSPRIEVPIFLGGENFELNLKAF